jgi:hypothetical protein
VRHTCDKDLTLPWRNTVNEETFNMSIRKFLKMVGVRSQSEIERAVAKAIGDGRLTGSEALPVTMQLVIQGVALDIRFDGEIRLA